MFVKRDTPSPGSSDRSKDGIHCDLCGSSNPAVRCDKCSGHMFCLSCDDMYHRHPKRKQHLRKAVDSIGPSSGANVRLPPGQRSLVPGDPSKMPIPPPRKKKGKSFFPSFGGSNEIPAIPKKEFSITEKLGSIRRFMSNRPLPPIPKDELPLKSVLIKPPGYPPEGSPMNERHNMERTGKPESPQYQNIMAHLTKVAQNSADEWDEDPSVSTSGSTRGSSGGDDIGWGQDINPPPKGVAPPLRGRDGRMQQSTSLMDLQMEPVAPPQPISPSFYPAPYPHFYAPQPGMIPQGYPGGFGNFPAPYYRGSWNNLRRKEGGEEEHGNEDDEARYNDRTLTRDPRSNTLKSQMKRSKSVMYDPMMVPNAMFPFGAYPPGYPNTGYYPQYWPPQTQHLSTPPSPTPSTRSLTRMNNRERRKKDYQQQRGEDSASSSSRSRESLSRRRNRGQKAQPLQQAYDSSEQAASSEGEPQEEKRPSSKQENRTDRERRDSSQQEENANSEAEESEEESGPPPIPTMPWECTFCTFINQPGTRVCTICCKTMSNKKSKAKEEEEEVEQKPEDSKPPKSKSKHKKKEEVVEFSAELIKEQEELEKEIRRQIEATLKLRGGSPGERASPITSEAAKSLDGESNLDTKSHIEASLSSSPIPPSPHPPQPLELPKASVDSQTDTHEISTSTEPVDSMQTTLSVACETQTQAPAIEKVIEPAEPNKDSNDAVSTKAQLKTDSSCQTNGNSKTETIHSVGTGTEDVDNVPLNVTKVEMGTSPPSGIDHMRHLDVPSIQRANSQRSLHEDSPREDLSNRAPLLRSLSRASLTSEPAVFGSRDTYRRPSDLYDFEAQRRMETSDWRKKPQSDWTNRHMSKSQFLGGYDSSYNRRDQPDRHYRISMEELVERRRQETMHAHGLEMVRLVRKAEQHGFLPDDVQVAVNHCNSDQDPVEWLEENWTNMIETVVTLATNYGHDKPENDVGVISAAEAKEALRLHKGNIWASVTECVETRQRKFIELSTRGNFTRREIIAALMANNGNMELSYSELTRTTHKPFIMNVWGPGSGVDNMDRPEFMMPEYNRQSTNRGYLEPFSQSVAQKFFPYMEHRKGNTNSKDFHRSMLNINLESSMAGYSPNLGRRYSFASGQRPDFGPPSNYSHFQSPKSNYDASDSMSVTSEDFENVDVKFRGSAPRTRSERKGKKIANRKRSTSFLDKLATLRKDRTKTSTLEVEPADYELDSSEIEHSARYDDRIKQEKVNDKPKKKSFLNRLLNRSPPPTSDTVEVNLPIPTAGTHGLVQLEPTGFGSNLGSKKSLQLGDLDQEVEVSSLEKVQAFLDIMPESPKEEKPVQQEKKGFLSRLGIKSSKLSLSSKQEEKQKVEEPKVETVEQKERQSTFYVEDDRIFEDQDLSIYQGFINLDHILQDETEDEYVDKPETEPQTVEEVKEEIKVKKPSEPVVTIQPEAGKTKVPNQKSVGGLSKATNKPKAPEIKVVQDSVKENQNTETAVPSTKRDESPAKAKLNVDSKSQKNIDTDDKKQEQEAAIIKENEIKKFKESELFLEIKETIMGESLLVTHQSVQNQLPKPQIESPVTETPQPVVSEGAKDAVPVPKAKKITRVKSRERDPATSRQERLIKMAAKSKAVEIPLDPEDADLSDSQLPPYQPMDIIKPQEEEIYRPRMGMISFVPQRQIGTADVHSEAEHSQQQTETTEIDQKTTATEVKVNLTDNAAEPKTEAVKTKALKARAEVTSTEVTTSEVTSYEVTADKTQVVSEPQPPPNVESPTSLDKPKRQRKLSPKKEPTLPQDVSPASVKEAKKQLEQTLPVSEEKTAAKKKSEAPRIDQSVQTSDKPKRKGKVQKEPEEAKVQSSEPMQQETQNIEVSGESQRTKMQMEPGETKIQSLEITQKDTQEISGEAQRRKKVQEEPKETKVRGAETTKQENQHLKIPGEAQRRKKAQEEPEETKIQGAGSTKQENQHRKLSGETQSEKNVPHKSENKEVQGAETTQQKTKLSKIPGEAQRKGKVQEEPNETEVQSADTTQQETQNLEFYGQEHSEPEEVNKESVTTSADEEQSANKDEPTTKSTSGPRRRRRPTSEQAESPTPDEGEQEMVLSDSSKHLPAPYTPYSRRRRSVSTDRGGYVRVRSRATSQEVKARADVDDKTLEQESIVDAVKPVDRLKSPDKDDDSKPMLSRSTSEAGARGSRFRRQRSISRDRASKGTTPSPPEAKLPSKDNQTSTGGIAKEFHYLKSTTAESLRPRGNFVEKRQASKDGSSPTKETSAVAQPKSTPSKSKVEPKKQIDGPSVSGRRIVLDKTIKELQAAGKCDNYEQAEMAARLMEMNFVEKEALEAAKQCGNLYQAISFLQQDCELCAGKFPVAEMVSMVNCTHRACRGCLTKYFTIQIRDRNILEMLCPFCNEPDLSDDDVASDYFNNMDQLLKILVDYEIHELFHRKLRDRALMKDPLFRWCSQCSSGFIITNPNQKRLLCPDCKAVTCASCRKRWEKQHEGISCEQFLSWKEANDPEVQAAGLAQHLAENGIDCPNCNFRYSLAKGGCMHFRCIQCQYDFCSGCGKPFKMGSKCNVSQFCSKLGLHAHHPRNCLFYLRDKEPTELQKLLDDQNISYNVKPTEGTEVHVKCQVNEQKETNDGLKDDICGKDVEEGFAGLCRVHYLEYLGGLITKNDIDPVAIFNMDELELVLKRANIKLPSMYRLSTEEYRQKVLNLIYENLPLGKIEGENV